MRSFLGSVLIFAGLCGAAIGFLGEVTVVFPYLHPTTLEISISFGVFSIAIFLSGLYTAFLSR